MSDNTSETSIEAARAAVSWHTDVAALRYEGDSAGDWYDRQAFLAREIARELLARRWDEDALDYLEDALDSAREVGD
jgi:nuclear transport factor 2 (NTF2) superfamily protein